MSSLLWFLLSFPAVMSPPAVAVQVHFRVESCPLGSGNVKIYERISQNAHGGWDSDLASYASGGQWRTFRVATCMEGLFSLYNEDFSRTFTAAERVRLEVALKNRVAALAVPDAPEIWERYGIAAAMYTELGKDAAFLGELWLEASWTARDAAVGYYPGLEGPAGARTLLDAGGAELAKPLAVEDRKKVLFNLVRIAERAGLPTQRDLHLAAFESSGPMTDQEKTVVSRFKKLTREVIPELQDHVIREYTAALMTQGTRPEQRARMSYVLADTLRRRGRVAEASGLFAAVAKDPAAPAS